MFYICAYLPMEKSGSKWTTDSSSTNMMILRIQQSPTVHHFLNCYPVQSCRGLEPIPTNIGQYPKGIQVLYFYVLLYKFHTFTPIFLMGFSFCQANMVNKNVVLVI